MEYSFAPSRCTSRETATSSKSTLNTRLESCPEPVEGLSNTSVTLARLPRATDLEPFQIKSSPRLPRSDFMDCSPSTQRSASATFDLPEPFGPTIAVMGTSKEKRVFLAKLLKPAISTRFNIGLLYQIIHHHKMCVSRKHYHSRRSCIYFFLFTISNSLPPALFF